MHGGYEGKNWRQLGISTVMCLMFASLSQGREWKAAEDDYTLEAELFAFNEDHVVLKRADGELGMLKLDDLSDADREYLKSDEAKAANEKQLTPLQTWELTGGLKLVGRIVDFAQGPLILQRRRGQTYVNDRRFSNLPDVYRQLLRTIVEHFEGVEIPNDAALQNWLRTLRGQPRIFQMEGVVLELENGDEYAIPFFAFPEADRRWLKAGWANYQAAKQDEARRASEAFRLESFAAAHFQNLEQQRHIAEINLKLQAIQAGLTSAWEVTLYPEPGNPFPPRWVVTLGRNSAQATARALDENPGFVAGPVRRVSR